MNEMCGSAKLYKRKGLVKVKMYNKQYAAVFYNEICAFELVVMQLHFMIYVGSQIWFGTH